MNMNKIKKYISSQANQLEIRNTGAAQIKSNWWRQQGCRKKIGVSGSGSEEQMLTYTSYVGCSCD